MKRKQQKIMVVLIYNNYREIILYINLNDPHGDDDKKEFVMFDIKITINSPREP